MIFSLDRMSHNFYINEYIVFNEQKYTLNYYK